MCFYRMRRYDFFLFFIPYLLDCLGNIDGIIPNFFTFGKNVVIQDAGAVIIAFFLNGKQVFLLEYCAVIINGLFQFVCYFCISFPLFHH